MRAAVSLSGGVGSWAAARRWINAHGADGVVALFADTGVEDADTYRFVREAAQELGVELVWLGGDRTIWDVFQERRFLGNTRVDVCSRVLKREPINAWLTAHGADAATRVIVGIDWQERFRFDRLVARARKDGIPWQYVAPLCEPPLLWKDDLHAWAERAGLRKQWLYQIRADHANCGGGCVKMGHGGFARLLASAPGRFQEWADQEERLREVLGKDVAILRDRRGGETRPLPLAEFRRRLESGEQLELEERGACGCFVGGDDD